MSTLSSGQSIQVAVPMGSALDIMGGQGRAVEVNPGGQPVDHVLQGGKYTIHAGRAAKSVTLYAYAGSTLSYYVYADPAAKAYAPATGLDVTLAPDGSLMAGGVAVTPTQTVGTGNTSTQASTVTGTGGIDVGNTNTLTLTLAADSATEVAIAKVNQVQYFGVGNLTGAAHIVGAFNYSYVDAAGKTVALAIGSENSIGNNNGTITRANSSLNTINGNAAGKTITLWTGATSVPTNNAGTLTKAQGFRAEVTTGNTGTIGEWAGFYNEDVSAIAGITARYAFVNNDAGAVFKSKAPFCDSSFVALSPTNGGTTNIPAGVGLVVLNSGAGIAGCTLAFAAAAGFTDGQKITFYSVFAITTPAYTSAGVTQLGFPATIAAGAFFTVQYAAVGPYWVRVG